MAHPPGTPFFHNVSCSATLVWPGGPYFDLYASQNATMDWNGAFGINRVDAISVDCYDSGGDVMVFGAPPGSSHSSSSVTRRPGTYGLDVYGRQGQFGGYGSSLDGVQGSGSLTVSCPVISITADGGTVYTFPCDPGVPLLGPGGQAWVDLAAHVSDKLGGPVNLQYLYSCSALPAGLSITNLGVLTNGASRLSGTLTMPGTYAFSFSAVACGTDGVPSVCLGGVTCQVVVSGGPGPVGDACGVSISGAPSPSGSGCSGAFPVDSD